MPERVTHTHYHRRPAHSVGARDHTDDAGRTIDPVLRCNQEGTFDDGEARYKCDHGVVVTESKDGWW